MTMPANTPPIEELERALEKANEPKPHRQVKEWMAGRADDAACRQWQERVRAAELELLAALPQLLALARLGLLVREGGEEVELTPFKTGDPGKYVQSLIPTTEWKAVAKAAAKQGLSISLFARMALKRAVLRTLEGLVK